MRLTVKCLGMIFAAPVLAGCAASAVDGIPTERAQTAAQIAPSSIEIEQAEPDWAVPDPAMDRFVSDLLAQMTFDEKIGQLTLLTSNWESTGPTMRDSPTRRTSERTGRRYLQRLHRRLYARIATTGGRQHTAEDPLAVRL